MTNTRKKKGTSNKGGRQPGRLRCAIYTRKSTDKGLEQSFNSLDAQREACEAYVRSQASEGWVLLPEHYDDGGFSGANTDRPAFQRLMDEVAAERVDAVVVYKVDRISRSLLDFAQFMRDLEKTKVGFVSVTQRFSTQDSMGKLVLNMLMSFAEFEREMIAERTRDKVHASRRRGKWTGGTVPLGYDVVDRKLVVNKVEALLARHIFERYLALQSTLKVVHELNAAGYRTKARKRKDKPTKHAALWSVAAVVRVLRNPIYAGFIGMGKERFPGEHKGIIEVDVFDEVGRILDSHGSEYAARHGRNPAYLLRGILRCQCCGKPFIPASTRKQGKEYRYYRCETRDKLGAAACEGRSLPAGAIEEYVLGKIREELATSEMTAAVLDELTPRIEVRSRILRAQQKAIPREIADLSAEGRRLAKQMEGARDGVRRLLDERLRDLGAKLDDAEQRLAEVERQIAALDGASATREWVAATLTDFDPMWAVMTDDNRARLARVLIDRVVVDGATGDIEIALADLAATVMDGVEGSQEEEACEEMAAAAGA